MGWGVGCDYPSPPKLCHVAMLAWQYTVDVFKYAQNVSNKSIIGEISIIAMFVHETLALNIYRDRHNNIFNSGNQYGKYCFEC